MDDTQLPPPVSCAGRYHYIFALTYRSTHLPPAIGWPKASFTEDWETMTNLEEEIREIVEIVALVPESLKVMCFEMLLKDALAKRHSSLKTPPSSAPAFQEVGPKTQKLATTADESGNEKEAAPTPAPGAQPKVNGGSDIVRSDIHVKTKRFMTNNDVTLEHINNVFYKEGESFELLITDFGAKNMADGQMRIAMLQALHQALTDGNFTATVETVREGCKMRKCLDATNFTANFKNNAGLFDFGEWLRGTTNVRLSEEGKKALAEVVKNLS